VRDDESCSSRVNAHIVHMWTSLVIESHDEQGGGVLLEEPLYNYILLVSCPPPDKIQKWAGIISLRDQFNPLSMEYGLQFHLTPPN